MLAHRPRYFLPILFFIVAAAVFRWPAFLNADAFNADHAVAALQARHIALGEWDWFLWGVGYQASFEPLLAALSFSVFGESALSFMLVAFAGYLLQLTFAYLVLAKRLGTSRAMATSLFLVFLSQPVMGPTIYPPREWCLTFAFAAVYFLDRASESRRSGLCFILGMVSLFVSLYVDFFTISFVVPIFVFGVLCALDEPARDGETFRRFRALVVGVILGGALLAISRKLGPHGGAPLAIHGNVVLKNLGFLLKECLPAILGYPGVGIPEETYVPGWLMGSWGATVRSLAALLFTIQMTAGGCLAFQDRTAPWKVRRLGVFGILTAGATLAGFLLSPGIMDRHASRYLAPLIWTAPFTLAPLVYRLPISRFFLLSGPSLLILLVIGWFGYGEALDGRGLPALAPNAIAVEERNLGDFLREKKVTAAHASYWLSYRLTFLYRENPVVSPGDPRQDRYPPYARAFETAAIKAHIFDGRTEQAAAEEVGASLHSAGTAFQTFVIGHYRVFVIGLELPTT